VQTHVRTGVTLFGSRRRVQGMNPTAPQRGQRSAFWPGCSSDGSHGILEFMPVILR